MRTLIGATCILSTFLCNANDDLNRAIKLFEQGDFEQSEPLFESLIDGESATPHFYIALINDLEHHFLSNTHYHPKYDKAKDRKAKKHYRIAIELGHCYSRYHFYRYTKSLHPLRQVIRNRKAFRLATIACLKELAAEDDPDALYMLGDLITIDTGNPTQKVIPIVEKIIKHAQNGNPNAQFYLGKVYSRLYFRDYPYQDSAKAFAWYATAAYNNHYQAKFYANYTYSFLLTTDEERVRAKNLGLQYIADFSDPTDIKP